MNTYAKTTYNLLNNNKMAEQGWSMDSIATTGWRLNAKNI